MKTPLDADVPAFSTICAATATAPTRAAVSASASANPADQSGGQRAAIDGSQAPAALADLHDLLSQGQSYPPEYRDQLANHLPMALHALFELGASAQQLRAFESSYARRFEGLASAVPAPAATDWLALRGQMSAYAPLRACFEAALAQEGRDALLRRVLPELMEEGLATAAFHGLIRTAHAIQAGHEPELASALAYWASRWQALPAPRHAAEPPNLALPDWVAALAAGAQGWRSEAPLIQLRMQEASATPIYQALADALAPAADAPTRVAELAQLALAIYMQTRNFTVLHMITGLRALRIVLPWLARPERVQVPLARALAAAYLAGRVQPMVRQPAVLLQSWPEVLAVARASDDDHLIKLVHACQDEARAYRESRYLQAAALAVAMASI
nr:questin oxidase family protein [uncultured Roseateles sp.]